MGKRKKVGKRKKDREFQYPRAKKKLVVDSGWTHTKDKSFGSGVVEIFPEWEAVFRVENKKEWEARSSGKPYSTQQPIQYPAYLYQSGSRYEIRY
jgi:hypothetical protein